MIFESCQIQEALEKGCKLPFAMIRAFSSVSMGETAKMNIPAVAEILEARFFGGQEEIRLFRTGSSLVCGVTKREAGDTCVVETYSIDNPQFGRELTVCHFLADDEDGQSYVLQTILCGWKGAKV